MCGIAGVYYFDRARHCADGVVESMARTMVHRGPDGEGYRRGPGYALGHRRLSIIDLAGGAQPLRDEAGTAWLVANGEIYNFEPLRERLSGLGHSFRTSGDCETVVQAHAQWGDDAVDHFNGMFAYALMDERADRLVLVRDRLGIKPLYFAQTDHALIFASEIKALLAYPGMEKELDVSAVSSYLNFRYVVGERTFFKGISQLQPGHILTATRGGGGGVSIRPYWSIPHESELMTCTAEQAVVQVREALADSVRERMISDVPFGSYLSGGVDSSAIVALMAQRAREPVKTYSIGFEEEGYNEFDYARLVAERYATQHREIELSADHYFDLLSKLIRYKDGPLGVPNEVPLWQMSKILKKDITVVLSGEGADELFAGYGRIFRAADVFDRGESTASNVCDFFLHRYSYFGQDNLDALLSADLRQRFQQDPYPTQVFRDAFESLPGLSTLRQFQWVFQRHHLPGLLQRLDVTTMATSVEGRVPFVDHRMVELGHRLPTEYKLRWKSEAHRKQAQGLAPEDISEVYDTPKWVLRQAVENLLPESVLTRKKVGFPVPLGQWLGGSLTARARDVLLDQRSRERGLLNTDAIAERLEAPDSDSWSEGMRIWMLLNLETFIRQTFDDA